MAAAARPFQAHILADFIEHRDATDLGLAGERRQQQIVAQGIDHARDALRTQVNLGQQLFGEDRLLRHAGVLQAADDIFNRVAQREGLQGSPQHDALL